MNCLTHASSPREDTGTTDTNILGWNRVFWDGTGPLAYVRQHHFVRLLWLLLLYTACICALMCHVLSNKVVAFLISDTVSISFLFIMAMKCTRSHFNTSMLINFSTKKNPFVSEHRVSFQVFISMLSSPFGVVLSFSVPLQGFRQEFSPL